MKNQSWLRTIQLSLVILCIAAVSGVGQVAANQRGDASLPDADAEGGWIDLGIDFASPTEDSDTADIVGDVYVLPSTGAEIVIADGVTASDPAESSFEDQVLMTFPGGIGAVAVISGFGQPVSTMEAYVGGFAESMDNAVEVDVQVNGQFAQGLYQIDVNRETVYLFIAVDTASFPGSHIIQVTVGPSDTIGESIALFRENVAVNGDRMFADINEQSVQDLVDQHQESLLTRQRRS